MQKTGEKELHAGWGPGWLRDGCANSFTSVEFPHDVGDTPTFLVRRNVAVRSQDNSIFEGGIRQGCRRVVLARGFSPKATQTQSSKQRTVHALDMLTWARTCLCILVVFV